MSDIDVEDHYNPSIRLLSIEKNGLNCGFELTRGKWDPYPWVKSVDDGTAADVAGLIPGDCLLEVNGEDVLGRRISDVAEIVKSKSQVSLLLWNAGVDSQCSPEAICCGPMPTNLQKLSACMSSVLTFLECPVCLDTIPPPTYQCENGHVICMRCRTKAERCPICRVRYNRGRSLFADQVYNALIDSFDLRKATTDSRKVKIQEIFKTKRKNAQIPEIKVTPSHTTKLLARLVGKSSSVENLAQNQNEFHLRAKSLSNQEIFRNDSPAISRSGSMSRLCRNELNVEYLSPSCHASLESLTLGFYCPFRPTCDLLIKGFFNRFKMRLNHNFLDHIIEHFQLSHDGPLVQFFKPNIKIRFSELLVTRNLLYMVHIEKHTFFVNLEMEENITQSNSENVFLWTWLLDEGKVAKEYDMQVQVLIGNDDNVILSVRNNVLSLNSTSSKEIRELKKGVLFNTSTFTKQSEDNIIFDLRILKSDFA